MPSATCFASCIMLFCDVLRVLFTPHSVSGCITLQHAESEAFVFHMQKPSDVLHVLLATHSVLGLLYLTIWTDTFVHCMQEHSDAMLSLLMSTITKGLHNVNELTDKYNTAYNKLGRRRNVV